MADSHNTDEAPGGNTQDAADEQAEQDLLQILCLKHLYRTRFSGQ